MMSLSGNIVKSIFTESVNEEMEGLAVLLYIHFSINACKTELNKMGPNGQVEKNKN